MDKYHIYEEIGKGEFSQVFKGREKKKIEYVAIKRVDKGMMAKVVNEVQIMHRIDSPHVLKFHDWYETRNNLWLILEYCTGADLEALLKKDGHLPEPSVRSFSLDILAGLKHMHQLGVLHCDIRPRNALIDEYGILKISDFKLAKKIPTQPFNDIPLSQRGIPSYMAPELFTPEGCHSYLSDLWGLGCLMFQLRRGLLPFGDEDQPTQQIIENIRTVKPLSAMRAGTGAGAGESAPNLSNELEDLLLWVLEKSPADRCSWEELSVHPFWRDHRNDAPANLPSQPAFDAMINDLLRKEQEALSLAAEGEVGVHGKLRELPRIMNDASIEDDDEDQVHERPDSSSVRSYGRGSAHAPSTPSQLTQASLHESEGRCGSQSGAGTSRPSSAAPSSSADRHRHRRSVQHLAPGKERGPATDVDTDSAQPESLIVDDSDLQVKPIVGNRSIEVIERTAFKASLLSVVPMNYEAAGRLSASELQGHLTQVYRVLSKAAAQAWSSNNSSSTSSAVVTALETVNSGLAYLCSLAPASEVANFVLNSAFLQLLLKLIRPTQQSSLGKTLSKTNPQSITKTLAVTALAMILRYTTYIQVPTTAKAKDEHIIQSLVLVLKDTARTDAKLKRRAVAALGEIVFYASAQDDDTDVLDATSGGDDAQGGRPKEKLLVPDAAFGALTRALKDDSDEIVRHYAAKTFENILTQGTTESRLRIVSLEVALRLWELSQSSRSEAMQATCGIALFHLLALVLASDSSTVQNLQLTLNGQQRSSLVARTLKLPQLSATGVKFVARVLDKGALQGIIEIVKEGQPRLQQAYLNILNLVFAGPISFLSDDLDFRREVDEDEDEEENTRSFMLVSAKNKSESEAELELALRSHRQFFCKSAVLVPSLLRLVEQGASQSVRAKALLSLQFVSRYSPSTLALLVDKRFAITLSRLLEHPRAQPQTQETREKSSSSDEAMYLHRVALSMLQFIRVTTHDSTRQLAAELNRLVNELGAFEEKKHSKNSVTTMEHPSSRTLGEKNDRSTSTTPSKSAQTTAVTPARNPAVGEAAAINAELVLELDGLLSSASTLRASVALLAVPSIRQHCVRSAMLSVMADALLSMSNLRVLIDHRQSLGLGSGHGEREQDLISTFQLVEEALTVGVETVSQFDLRDVSTGTSGPRHRGEEEEENGEGEGEGAPDIVDTMLLKFIPSMATLVSYPDGNVRLVVASSLRRLFPQALAACAEDGAIGDKHADAVRSSLNFLLVQMHKFLIDQPPIPQYVIRLLADVSITFDELRPQICSFFADESSAQGPECPTLVLLSDLLHSAVVRGEDSGQSQIVALDLDPQLVVFLCVLLEAESSRAALLGAGFVEPLASAFEASVSLRNLEISEALLDLIQIILENSGPSQQKTHVASSPPCSGLSTHLAIVTLPLLELMRQVIESNFDAKSSTKASYRDNDLSSSKTAGAHELIDSASSCLTSLLTLFGDTVTAQLVSKEWAVCGERSSQGVGLFSIALANALLGLPTKFRLLKIIFLLMKALPSMPATLAAKVREFVCHQSMRTAVGACTKISASNSPGAGVGACSSAEVSLESVVSFARQVELAIGSIMMRS